MLLVEEEDCSQRLHFWAHQRHFQSIRLISEPKKDHKAPYYVRSKMELLIGMN